jgi:hypothetical protein
MNQTQKARSKKWLWLAPLGVAGVGLGVLAALNMTTSAQTSPDADDARLRTRRYHASVREVMSTLETLVPNLRTYGANWRLAQSQLFDESTPNATASVEIEVPVTIFVDDLVVTLRRAGDATLVDARSQTRVKGKSDFGENRRHVIQLLTALDEKLERI